MDKRDELANFFAKESTAAAEVDESGKDNTKNALLHVSIVYMLKK